MSKSQIKRRAAQAAPVTPWTRFMDMHSGGGLKEAAQYIYIQAPIDTAKVVFYNRFGHNPKRVTCTCCGEDYSISEEPTLEKATAYERGCRYVYRDKDGNEVDGRSRENWNRKDLTHGYEEQGDPARAWQKYVPLDEYLASGAALVIRENEIKPEERVGSVPEQGYVWVE